jgi:hypothetical protein
MNIAERAAGPMSSIKTASKATAATHVLQVKW